MDDDRWEPKRAPTATDKVARVSVSIAGMMVAFLFTACILVTPYLYLVGPLPEIVETVLTVGMYAAVFVLTGLIWLAIVVRWLEEAEPS